MVLLFQKGFLEALDDLNATHVPTIHLILTSAVCEMQMLSAPSMLRPNTFSMGTIFYLFKSNLLSKSNAEAPIWIL